MKSYTFIVAAFFITLTGYAQDNSSSESIQQPVYLIEQTATFPGGEQNFYKFIGKNLKKPELVNLFGYKGRIVMGFTVDKTGSVKDIQAFSNSGMGYEKAFIDAISKSPFWKPAIQNGRPVEQKFTLPFIIDLPKAEIDINDLKSSNFKFTFQIKDKIYDINQAELMLGRRFDSNKINYIKSFMEQPEENQQKRTYLIQITD